MFDGVSLSDGEGVVARLTLTLSDEEGPCLVAHLQELLLRIGSLDTTKEPTEREGEEGEGGRGEGREGRGGGREGGRERGRRGGEGREGRGEVNDRL